MRFLGFDFAAHGVPRLKARTPGRMVCGAWYCRGAQSRRCVAVRMGGAAGGGEAGGHAPVGGSGPSASASAGGSPRHRIPNRHPRPQVRLAQQGLALGFSRVARR
eukprot:1086711-Rhodomonas_salina.1